MTFRCVLFLCLLFFSTECQETKRAICLNMIVKNENPILKRCLESVMPFIDYWVIVDTGSTDGTQELIKQTMKDVPGELHERPWVNFAHNRNEALELARNHADYILIMDADDKLDYPAGHKLPELKDDGYQLKVVAGQFSQLRPHFIKSAKPWHWVGVMHEHLACSGDLEISLLPDIIYVDTREGARSKDPEKYIKDARVLEEALKKEPDNARYAYYLAQSYRDADEKELALKWYQKRIEMSGAPEETFGAKLQYALIAQKLNYSEEDVINSFYRAHRERPHRAEPIYYLAEIYTHQRRPDLAYATIKYLDLIPKPPQSDASVNQDWIEKYGLSILLSFNAYMIGHYQESIDICDKILAMPDLPIGWRKQTEENRKLPLEKLKAQKQ